MKLYDVYYRNPMEDEYHYSRFWAESTDEAIGLAKKAVGAEPSGKPGPSLEAHFRAEVAL